MAWWTPRSYRKAPKRKVGFDHRKAQRKKSIRSAIRRNKGEAFGGLQTYLTKMSYPKKLRRILYG